MKRDLITLADVPALKGKDKSPTTVITVARLGKYSDPRYGSFGITKDDYAGWSRNLAETFGGRVSIDADHSADRGGGTRAMGWITGLELDGKDVKATVEWTKPGARAIRDRTYTRISPTFVSSFKDEHGEDRGRALIGAALTNRPVLRQLPVLSLSATVEGTATPSGAKPKKANKSKAAMLGPLPAKRGKRKKYWKQKKKQTTTIKKALLAAGVAASDVKTLTADMAPELKMALANQQGARELQIAYAMSRGGAVAAFAKREDLPADMTTRVDPQRAEIDAAARRMAAKTGLEYLDCAALIAEQSEVVEPLAAVDGSNPLEHLDSSAPRPVAPYAGKDADGKWTQPREELFQRDLRRAGAAGVTDLDRDMYDAYSEQGRDLAFELAQEVRATRLADARANVDNMLSTAKRSAAQRQQQATDRKVLERQREKHAKAIRAHEDAVQNGDDRFVGW